MITREQLRLATERRARELGLSVEELNDKLDKHMDYLASIHTPNCISAFDVDRMMDGEEVLNEEGWEHVISCEYCQKFMPVRE